ncbi:MAG: Do family serine endopeptidase [Endomicrobiales bacterium]|nr:Do family serine endopeptidase [Endomicrobiales bacterium]
MSYIKSNLTKFIILILIVLLPFFIWAIVEKKCVVLDAIFARYNPGDFKLASGVNNPVTPGQELLSLQESFVRIAENVKPAVVNISTVHTEKYAVPQYEFFFGSPFEDFFEDYFNQPRSQKGKPKKKYYERKFEGAGSGVIIDPKGYILTNEHVVRSAEEITVTLSNEKKYKGKVVGKDAKTDLAVIKIKAGKLPYASLGDSDKIKVGQWVVAIGSPFGLEQTVTSGIISAVRQSLSIEGREYRHMIQTDAAINRGNSGGPLCDINGNVIGINSAIYAPTGVFSGVGFAIPINNAKEILDDLIQKGKVVRGWLGVEIRPVDKAIAKYFGLKKEQGVLINRVMKNSPADKAGLKRGDVIIMFNGEDIDEVKKLQSVVAKTKPKKKVVVKVIRDGGEITVELVTGEMPSEEELASSYEDAEETPGQEEIYEWEGLTVAQINEPLIRKYSIPDDEKGCVVVNLESGSIAEEIGVFEGDLIRSINRKQTPNITDFRDAVKDINLSEGIVLDISRQGRQFYISYTKGK